MASYTPEQLLAMLFVNLKGTGTSRFPQLQFRSLLRHKAP
jgi:hypothetical protein